MAVVNHKCLEINDKSWVMSRVVNRFTNRYWHTAIRLFLDAMRRTEPTFAEPKERNSNERGSPEAVVVQIRKMDEVDPEAIIVNLGAGKSRSCSGSNHTDSNSNGS